MTDIRFLGTGGAVPSAERDNMSFLLNHDGVSVLVDCPGGAFVKIKALGIDPRSIGHIAVTHVHPDHVYGLPAFIHSLMLDEGEVVLWGSAETVAFCGRLLDLFNLRAKKILRRIAFRVVETGGRADCAPGVGLSALRMPHHSSSLAFRFDLEGKTIAYSGDTPAHPPFFAWVAGCDVLIHDCSVPSRCFREFPAPAKMHTHALDLGRLSEEAGVKLLVPGHFFGEVEYDMAEVEDEIRLGFGGRLVIPADLMTIAL
ncbi:MAG: ribonuclease Z [Candidatus Aminicenantes bacterium]|nr:ribonuclease Z [Candidatus Aminicenantes bacterium]